MSTRDEALKRLTEETWDVLIIGGGATGLGAALNAVARGYRTLLLEQSDFAKATSSRSTKLIHGGVRYLQQGNVSLVRESLHERGLLLRDAPAFVRPLEFVIPARSWAQKMYYGTGLKMYDLLAGSLGMQRSALLSRSQTLQRLPTLNRSVYSGGVSYFDAQFDDAGLAVAVATTVNARGGTALNYVRVLGFLKQNGRLCGVQAADGESGETFQISARTIINATGIFSDETRQLDEPDCSPTLSLSQGAHLVVDRSFLPGQTAVIVPRTDDGRVLFLIPWLGATLIGTTDLPVEQASLEPRPLHQEIEFLLAHANRYLEKPILRSDLRSCFAGLRPLVKSQGTNITSRLSRDHVIRVSDSGLVSISGGKWTTFRRMGADVVTAAIRSGGLPQHPPAPEKLDLIQTSFSADPSGRGFEIPSDDFIRHCARSLQARTVEDVLARRSRLLFLHAAEAVNHAPHVARILAEERHEDEHWIATQVEEFRETAQGYLPI